MSEINSRSIIFGDTYSVNFDGQRFDGELGSIKDYEMDHYSLLLRGWQEFVESDIAQLIMNKFTSWVIGEGMKMQSIPVQDLVKLRYPSFDRKKWASEFEARFSLWQSSKRSSYSGEETIHSMSKMAYKTAKVGGDVLVLLRVEDSRLKVEIIDTSHLCNPSVYTKKDGEKLKDGVLTDDKGSHIGYYVRLDKYGISEDKFYRAYDDKGRRIAYLVYGKKHRNGDCRGVSLFTTVLATIKSITRYKDASVEGAEQRANVPFFMEHKEFSTGESIYAGQMKNNLKSNTVEGGSKDPDPYSVKAAADIASSQRNSVHNMPKGSTIKSVESKMEINFPDFLKANLEIVTASLNMPIEVALSAYNSNYAASQGARTDWNKIVNDERADYAVQFYGPIMEMFVEVEAIKGNLMGSRSLALINSDKDMFEALIKHKFVGVAMKNIDPVKDVKAWRELLGPAASNIPLATVDEAIEALSKGDFQSVLSSFTEERTDFQEQIGDKIIEDQREKITQVETSVDSTK
ncbi:MAG: phage portal protein [Psychroserpens sp.]|nr:phage portal protein [Psychroserpens sp.]